MEKPTLSELQYRIDSDIKFHNGALPEVYVACWQGYLAGLLEWGLVSVSAYEELTRRLPHLAHNPATAILSGREDK